MLVLEKTHPTKLVITGQPDEVAQVERMLDFFHKDIKVLEKETGVDGNVVQQEILQYLGVPLGALMLKHYRKYRGLTQHELARALKTTRRKISDLETGKIQICREFAEQLAQFFDVSAETFLKKQTVL